MRFTIRDLFLVTVIVALAVGWCVDRSRLTSFHSDTVRKLEVELAKERAKAERAWHVLSLPHSSSPAPNPPKP